MIGRIMADETIGENQTGPAASEPAARPGRGGRRPGAGRPKGARDISPRVRMDARSVFSRIAERRFPRIVAAYVRRAEQGDTRAGQDLLNRIIGPAPQRVEVSGPGGAAIAVQQLAPVALALMSTDELRALATFHRRLGLLPPALAIDVAPGPPEEPGPDAPPTAPSSPLSLTPSELTRAPRAPQGPRGGLPGPPARPADAFDQDGGTDAKGAGAPAEPARMTRAAPDDCPGPAVLAGELVRDQDRGESVQSAPSIIGGLGLEYAPSVDHSTGCSEQPKVTDRPLSDLESRPLTPADAPDRPGRGPGAVAATHTPLPPHPALGPPRGRLS